MAAINIFITPTEEESGLTTISLGLYQALDSRGLRVGFLKPVAPHYDKVERSSYLARNVLHLTTPDPLPLNQVQKTISQGKLDQVLEDCVAMHADVAKDCDVVLIEGLIADTNEPYTPRLNIEIAKALDASILLVVNGLQHNVDTIIADIKLQMSLFGPKANFMGSILNKVLPPGSSSSLVVTDDNKDSDGITSTHLNACQNIDVKNCPILGVIPWQPELISPRTLDIARQLRAKIINQGELETRRVSRISLCARTVPNMIDELRPGTLIVTPGDRDDIIIAVAMAANNGTPLAGLLLTSGYLPSTSTDNLCQQAWNTGLPILSVESNSYATATDLSNMSTHVPMDDVERVKRIMSTICDHIEAQKLLTYIGEPQQPRLSPAAFRHRLSSLAKSDKRRIVLPEGDEPRTIQAAIICQNKGIADCVLIGSSKHIQQVAQSLEVQLPEKLTIIQPEEVRENYVAKMVELRKHKNLSEPLAIAQLEDNVVLGTMMLVQDEVDGLVSGATHTTANTIRPALQLIKTATNAKLVSSIFFMGLPDQVLVYGDCAVNPDPNAEQLADIAIQSADSAKTMGIPVRVAMISYSTGQSGHGADVEKVREATALVQKLRPDITIDGPLQYDAATTASVAKSKAPDSPVAGQATVLVFPDLNTGNTTYKAVQRSANVISIGPMLQGLAKPVNDLSRGALVDDIVYTIALTAIQAQHRK